MTAKAFLRDQLKMQSLFYELHVLANAPNATFLDEIGVSASFTPVPIQRRISIWRDLRALLLLYLYFRTVRPKIVHSVTPKAGLLAMAAAFFTGVPCRIHTFTGQVWATKRGSGRWILMNMDRLIAYFTTHVLVDSHSQRDFLAANHVVSQRKATVLGQGSISGVDLHRFKPDPEARAAVRAELGVLENTLLFLYIGRLNRDKGIPELLEAFALHLAKYPQTRLLLVGPDEEGLDPLIPLSGGVLRVGYTDRPERYMAAADVLVLPSHREGFGSTVIEAAACGLPAIASRIYGLTDAVVDGETGLLHQPGSVQDLASVMETLAHKSDLRERMGKSARNRASLCFDMDAVTQNTIDFYRKALNQHTKK